MTGLTVHRASCMQGSDKLGRPQSPFSGIQHTEFEDSVMPQASSQKEAREVAPPIPSHKGGGTKAADPKLYHRLFTESRADVPQRQTKPFSCFCTVPIQPPRGWQPGLCQAAHANESEDPSEIDWHTRTNTRVLVKEASKC